ncbi:hypothetical protein [Nesterenkonia natronophila]|uniref:Uncharacterized protein n=1 Tax=Nesterenkonia natronophila TaxID=2174932 RepID=A0A3A4F3Z8_9MICC|nr:hypothetical protein [Nesterenkonia natronophila]RJN32793.1 hypothetical protein D3250_02940 [Nesterenkonia natronophila]
MSLFRLSQLLAQPDIETDAPSWAPILFAGGAFIVVSLVLILMWKKLRQSEQWRGDEGPRDDSDRR